MIDRYTWSGGTEAMLRFGPPTGVVVIAILPLLEEANRTRGLAVAILRHLADRGIAGALPDLPGTGESPLPTDALCLPDLRTALATAVRSLNRPAVTLAIRSAALLDADAPMVARWLLAPQGGDDLLRAWRRLSTGEMVAGNAVAPALLAALPGTDPVASDVPTRVVRLDTDPRPADMKLPGAPPWHRSEPDTDLTLGTALADDIATWVRRCAA